MDISKFKLKKALGRGAFGVVYLAEYINAVGIQRKYPEVALKRVKCDDPQEVTQAFQEGWKVRPLSHPNIVQYLEVFVDTSKNSEDGSIYVNFVMEYINGGDVQSMINDHIKQDHKRIPQHIILDFCCQILSALDYLHKNNFIHRDISPKNIFIETKKQATATTQMEDISFKLGDFGFATQLDKSFTTTQAGTPQYTAPEIMLKEKYAYKVDMWSFGVVLFEMLTLNQSRVLHMDIFRKRNLMEELEAEVRNRRYHPYLWMLCEKTLKAEASERENASNLYNIASEVRKILQLIKMFSKMNKDIFFMIFSFLDVSSITSSVAYVDSNFYSVTKMEALWEQLYHSHFIRIYRATDKKVSYSQSLDFIIKLIQRPITWKELFMLRHKLNRLIQAVKPFTIKQVASEAYSHYINELGVNMFSITAEMEKLQENPEMSIYAQFLTFSDIYQVSATNLLLAFSIECFEVALLFSPERWEYMRNIAFSYSKLNNLDLAMTWIDKAIQKNPKEVQMIYISTRFAHRKMELLVTEQKEATMVPHELAIVDECSSYIMRQYTTLMTLNPSDLAMKMQYVNSIMTIIKLRISLYDCYIVSIEELAIDIDAAVNAIKKEAYAAKDMLLRLLAVESTSLQARMMLMENENIVWKIHNLAYQWSIEKSLPGPVQRSYKQESRKKALETFSMLRSAFQKTHDAVYLLMIGDILHAEVKAIESPKDEQEIEAIQALFGHFLLSNQDPELINYMSITYMLQTAYFVAQKKELELTATTEEIAELEARIAEAYESATKYLNMMPDNDDLGRIKLYNLACTNAICNKAEGVLENLEKLKHHERPITKEEIIHDVDFENVRNCSWFQEFIATLQ